MFTNICDLLVRKITKSEKPMTTTVKEDEEDFELTTDMKTILDERLLEDKKTYLTSEDSINQLSKKYGV